MKNAIEVPAGEIDNEFSKWLGEGYIEDHNNCFGGFSHGYERAFKRYARIDPAPEPVALPDDLLYALNRMCTPLHESMLTGATAQEDARCMKLIRDYVLAHPPVKEAMGDDNPNAPWLSLAHGICTEHGVPQGNIEWRLEVLKELFGATDLREVVAEGDA